MLSVVISVQSSLYLWVSRHETVDIVVDLLEREASVHQGETALHNEAEMCFCQH